MPADPLPRHFLVTGGTGLVGGYMLSRLVRRPVRVTALVRAADDNHARQRLARMGRYFGLEKEFAGIQVATGDLMMPRSGLSEELAAFLKREVTDVFHAAAATGFEDDADLTTTVTNHATTAAMLDIMPPEARLFHVSTAYVAGIFEGEFPEDNPDLGQRFHNAYEQSKMKSEMMVREAFAACPERLTVLRPSIVVGESRTGRTTQFSSFYAFLKVIARFAERHPGGTLGIPNHPEAPHNYIPVDLLTDMIEEIVATPGHWGRTYNLVNTSPPTSADMQRMLESVLGIRIVGGADTGTSSRFYQRILQRNAERYFPYLIDTIRFATGNLRRLASARPSPVTAGSLQILLDYARTVNWRSGPENARGKIA